MRRLRIAAFAVAAWALLGPRPHGAAEDAAPPAAAEYTYNADKLRDPFIPPMGAGGGMDMARGAVDEDFNPSSVELKGILQTKTSRWAVLRSPAGASYLVRNGKIHDPKRKVVEGYVGIVKEKSLVVIGPNNQVTELKLRKDQQKTP